MWCGVHSLWPGSQLYSEHGSYEGTGLSSLSQHLVPSGRWELLSECQAASGVASGLFPNPRNSLKADVNMRLTSHLICAPGWWCPE